MRIALNTVLVLALSATPALAHGGQYKGPGDASAGGAGGGGNVAPPTNPDGSAAVGPGASTGGATSTGGARTGRGGDPRKGGGRRGQPTTGGSPSATKGFAAWEFWWENNKDGFLDLKSRLTGDMTVSGGFSELTGRGNRVEKSSTRRPNASTILTDVIPALLDLVRQSPDRDILDSAILALGRTSLTDTADQVLEAALPLLAHAELSVQSSTALSLGVLGSSKAVPDLRSLLQDSSDGRRLSGGGSVHWLVRAFSALSLGLIGDQESTFALQDVIDRLTDKDKDIKVCAIVALGMAQQKQRAEVVDYLVKRLDDKRMDPLIASYIPTSLGKLGDPSAVEPLLRVFRSRDSANLLTQSAAIGLGQLASVGEHGDVIESLLDYVQEGKDQQTRHFSIIALAQIGARDPDPTAHRLLHDAIVKQFGTDIRGRGKSKEHRSWAALAGAIYARAHDDRQPALIERIEAAYTEESNPSFKSAFALALGLLDDGSFADQIFEDFSDSNEIDFRGYAGVALGFMHYTGASDALRGLCQNKSTTPTLRLQAATGLGLMGDSRAVGTLIGTLESAKTLGVSSAVAKALGIIGDRDSISPLKKVAMDESVQKITRAFACVALGIVGEKTTLPWNAKISANNNYRAKVASMAEVLDIL